MSKLQLSDKCIQMKFLIKNLCAGHSTINHYDDITQNKEVIAWTSVHVTTHILWNISNNKMACL